MMETIMIMMGAQAYANLNVVMDGSLELRNVIWVLTMPTLPTNANSPASSQDAVMDMLTLMRNVIMLHLDPLLLLAEIPVQHLTVEMELSMLSSVKNVIQDLTIMISHPLGVQLDAHKTLVEPSDPPPLGILIEQWPAPDVSTHTWVLPPDLHAQAQSIGWLHNQSKRFLNYKLTNSNTLLELESREVKKEIANSLILSRQELVIVSPPLDQLPQLPELVVHLFPESLPSKPHSIFSAEIPLKLQFSNKPS